MSHIQHIAEHFKAVFFGGNWTDVNVKDTLSAIKWEEATVKIEDFNTIAALTFHINYYVEGVSKVFEGGHLEIKDTFSYDVPKLNDENDWKNLCDKVLSNAEQFSNLIEQLPENEIWNMFVDKKYGSYYDNLNGIIQHTHYHLGQIVILKKLLKQKAQP